MREDGLHENDHVWRSCELFVDSMLNLSYYLDEVIQDGTDLGRWRLEVSQARLRFDRRTLHRNFRSSRNLRRTLRSAVHLSLSSFSPWTIPRWFSARSREIPSMQLALDRRDGSGHGLARPWCALGMASGRRSAGEPDPKSYWDVNDIRPGMKGAGRTVMVGTKLEEFGAEVLGVMRDVSPGRDMVLCRLTGCNLEHAGIIQGMSGSPIYIDGKLLGAVAFAWEFAKDPIAGVTPFSQMVQYVRSNDRRIAAESKEPARAEPFRAPAGPSTGRDRRPGDRGADRRATSAPIAGLGRGAGRDDADRHAAGGLGVQSPGPGAAERAAPAARHGPDGRRGRARAGHPRGGGPPARPGAPLSIAMVTGDFDLSGIGTVTHVEGDRVYGFGHPMFSLGACEFPMMTGYIHTVYPRASVSMKMGSPLKVVGVIDTDVSTSVAGRIGPKPDMLPLTRPGQDRPLRRPAHLPRPDGPRADPAARPDHGGADQRHRHRGEPARGADRPDQGDDPLKGHEPIELATRSAAPATPARWGRRRCSARSPRSSTSWSATRWRRSGSSRSTATSEIEPGPEGRRDRVGPARLRPVEPGQTLKAFVTLKPFKGERETVEVVLPIPADFPEGAVRGDRLRRRQQPPPPVPQRAGAARAARPGRASSRRSGSRPSPSGPRSTSTSPRPTAACRSRAGAAQPAGQRPGGLRVRAGRARSPPIRSDLIEVGRDALGRRRDAVAQVHGGQGRGVLALVSLNPI